MRDLAQQNTLVRSKRSLPMPAIKAAFLVVVFIAVLLLVKQKISSGSFIGGGSVELMDAQHGLTPVSVGSVNNAAGVNLTSQTATLASVKSGISGSATATRTYGDGTYNLSVSATLPNPHGNSYAVFLVGPDGPVFLDFMSGSATSWTLNFNDKDKYSTLNGIWVTEKITKEFKTPETHILEGSF